MSVRSNFAADAFASPSLQRFGRCGLFQHDGCVNTACFDDTGQFCATGSDDRAIKVWDLREQLSSPPLLVSVPTGHQHNIFCVDFVPGSFSRQIVSCSADGSLRMSDLNKFSLPAPRNRGSEIILSESSNIMHKFAFWPGDLNGNTIFTAEEAGYCRRIDIREAQSRNVTAPQRRGRVHGLWMFADREDEDEDGEINFDAGIVYRNFNSIKSAVRYRDLGVEAEESSSRRHRNQCKSVKYIAFPPSSSPISPYTIAIGGEGPFVRVCDIRMMMTDSEVQFNETDAGGSVLNVYDCSLIPKGLFYHNIKSMDPTLIGIDSFADIDREAIDSSSNRTGQQVSLVNHVSVSGIEFSKHSYNIVVSYQGDTIYQFNLHPSHDDAVLHFVGEFILDNHYGVYDHDEAYGVHGEECCYAGHINYETFLKSVHYFGPNDEYIVTGSDQGMMMIYDSRTQNLVGMFKADERICNGVIPHPHLPMLLSYGIDSDAKLWRPIDLDTIDPDDDSIKHKIVSSSFHNCNMYNVSSDAGLALEATFTSIVSDCSKPYPSTLSIAYTSYLFYDRLPMHGNRRQLEYGMFSLAADWNRLLVDVDGDEDSDDDVDEIPDIDISTSNDEERIARYRRKINQFDCLQMTNASTVLVNLFYRIRPSLFHKSNIPSSLSSFLDWIGRLKDDANQLVAEYHRIIKKDRFSCLLLTEAIDKYDNINELLNFSQAHSVNIKMVQVSGDNAEEGDDETERGIQPTEPDATRPFLINGGPVFIYILMTRARRIIMNMLNNSRKWTVERFFQMIRDLSNDDLTKLLNLRDRATRDLCELIVSSDYCIGSSVDFHLAPHPVDQVKQTKQVLSKWLSLLALLAKMPNYESDNQYYSMNDVCTCQNVNSQAATDGCEFQWCMSQLNGNACERPVDNNSCFDVSGYDDFRRVLKENIPQVIKSVGGNDDDDDGDETKTRLRKRKTPRRRRRRRLRRFVDDSEEPEDHDIDMVFPLPVIIRRLSIVLNLDSIHLHHEHKLDESNMSELNADPAFDLSIAVEDDVPVTDYSIQVMKLQGILNSNKSMCCLIVAELGGGPQAFQNAKEAAVAALKFIPDDVKSLFRLGCAELGLEEISNAVGTLTRAATLKPGDVAIRSKLSIAREALENMRQAQRNDEDKHAFSGLFNKRK